MTYDRRHSLPSLTWSLCCLSLPMLALGCSQFQVSRVISAPGPTLVRAVAAEDLPQPQPAEQATPKVLPMNLDTVLRLAGGQNALVNQARAKVQEAMIEKNVADGRWLPNIYVGVTYARHEGGIQDFNGNLVRSSYGSFLGGLELSGRYDIREVVFERINAARKLWQEQGELTKVSSEKLLEATEAYIDLLTARTGESIALGLEKELQDLLQRAEKFAEEQQGARVEVQRIRAELTGRQQILLKLREQAAGASAKLAYLLGLDPCTFLMPVDAQLAPLDLVDASPPSCELVARALANGPGVREMEGLLAVVHRSMEQARSRANLLPIFEICAGEGVFAAGPGSSSSWDNRFDLVVSARWNLTDFVTRCDKQRILDAKAQQAQFAYQDLRGKLSAGVQEARESSVQGKEQIRLTQQQIDYARKAVDLANERLRELRPGSSASEVLLSINSLSLAQVAYLSALRSYDRAQLRLMVLLDATTTPPCQSAR